MQVTWNFTYTEDIIPPRCRKPRPEKFEGKFTVEIPSLTEIEAPVAIIETDHDASPDVPGGKRCTRVRQYRWYNNQLWCDHQIDPFRDIQCEQIQPVSNGCGSSYQSLAQHQELAKRWAASRIIVNGIAHQPLKGEPRLLIMRGFLKGEYYVSIQRHFDYDTPRFKYSEFYRIDQMKQAIAECYKWVSKFERDDDKVRLSIPISYKILIPEALRLNPQADQAAADEERFQSDLQKLISNTKMLFLKDSDRHRALKEALTKFTA